MHIGNRMKKTTDIRGFFHSSVSINKLNTIIPTKLGVVIGTEYDKKRDSGNVA